MLNQWNIDGLLDELSTRSTLAKTDIIVLGDIIRETFSEDSEIWKAYRELYEQFQKETPKDGQRRNSKAHIREFKEIVTAAKLLASHREIPPPAKDQRERQERDLELIIDHKFSQSRWFTAAKAVLGLGLIIVMGGTASFGFVSVDLWKRINQVSEYVKQTEKEFDQKIDDETKKFIKEKEAGFDNKLASAAVDLAAEGRTKLDGIISKKENELAGFVSTKETELGGTIKAATDKTQTLESTYTQQVKQRQENLDKEQPKLDKLVNSVSEQETRLSGLASQLDGLKLISGPALDLANTLSSGTATNNLQLIGRVLKLSACILIGLSILALASLVASGIALFYSRKKARA
jgi:hypothetical protein